MSDSGEESIRESVGNAKPPREESQKKKQKQTDTLIAIGRTAKLFHEDETAYATVEVDGHLETYAVPSRRFRRLLLKVYFEQEGSAPNGESMTMAINTLAAFAQFKAPAGKAFLRIGRANDKLYLDLANPSWQVVEIDEFGWRVVESANCPIRFRRTAGMQPLPIPETGGRIDDLRKFINTGTDEDFALIVGWLLAAFRDRGPFPILILHGEHGSAKTTIALYLRNLIDPYTAPVRSKPRSEHDLVIAANNGWIVVFDNLSSLHEWLSDAVCRLSTKSGFSTRQLYTDQEEVIFEAQRPVMFNSIDEIATRGDLLDRAIIINLPRIAEEQRKLDTEFEEEFLKARPKILGALLVAVSAGLRNYPNTRLERLPRMADFAKWNVAAEPATGWKQGLFLRAYTANRANANDLTLDATLIWPVLKTLPLPISATATELLKQLDERADERTMRRRKWPQLPKTLSDELRRLAPAIARAGIEINFFKESGSGGRRIIEIKPLAESRRNPASPASQPEKKVGNSATFSATQATDAASQSNGAASQSGDGALQDGVAAQADAGAT
jgi:hypothetical protein